MEPLTAPPRSADDAPRKVRIQAAFARAAADYDQHGQAQRRAVAGLSSRLAEAFDEPPCAIYEIGCGTGNFTGELRRLFPTAQVSAVDFCPAMLEQAQAKLAADPQVAFALVDGETHLPAQRPFDLITSSSALQWFDDPEAAVRRFAGWLTPGGRLEFAAFGPDSYRELQAVLAADPLSHDHPSHDRRPPAAGFADDVQWRRMLERAFEQVDVEAEEWTCTFPSLLELLRSIHRTGVSGGGWRGWLTRPRFERIEAQYRERFGGLTCTYQVYYCSAFSPSSADRSTEAGSTGPG